MRDLPADRDNLLCFVPGKPVYVSGLTSIGVERERGPWEYGMYGETTYSCWVSRDKKTWLKIGDDGDEDAAMGLFVEHDDLLVRYVLILTDNQGDPNHPGEPRSKAQYKIGPRAFTQSDREARIRHYETNASEDAPLFSYFI